MMLHAGSAIAAAGQISLVASNVGWRTHELVILPLTGGATAGHRIAAPTARSPRRAAGVRRRVAAPAVRARESGPVGWVTVTLAAGRYELVCNLQNHYADGMHQELTVS